MSIAARSVRNSRASRGFTLVELLVVVAVIALLMGLLLPALGKARESARLSGCLSNMKQMVTAFTYYAEDAQEYYPVVTPSGVTVGPPRTSTDRTFAAQQVYGGLAGYFNLRQIPDDGKTAGSVYGNRHYNRGFYHVISSQGAGGWTTVPAAGLQSIPLMAAYMENSGDYEMLQCPSDSMDGGENGADFPSARPTKIGSLQRTQGQSDAIKNSMGFIPANVIWYNISYLYIAGLKRTEKSMVAMFGDETNSCDWGGTTGSQPGIGATPADWHQTLRAQRPLNLGGPGYSTVDNHGRTGGNFAYSDGHAAFIPQSQAGTDTPQVLIEIFDNINRARRNQGGTSYVQSID